MILIVTMFIFSLTMSFSPGPVNMIIISSAAAHGFRKTFPFVSGATTGFTALLIFVCFGFYAAIEQHPLFFKYLNVAGAVFIMYLGYKIASSHPDLPLQKAETPGFIQGFLMQWFNPKAWTACASGAALFSDPATRTTVSVFIMIYFLVCYLSLASWAILGDKVSMLLRSRQRIRTFNLLMGSSLIVTAGYMLCLPFLNHS
ncbi:MULTISPECIES: LysE family translocator [Raoultella]|uniref:LysE family translocator n=1 Tax=Raoultella TaxID=160674 RepID=UPI000F140886|nr:MULTISPECIES: LysE family translocator [Raoultella]EKR9382720.1 LysE family translocator [Raoultella ornithinolytica]EKV6722565.1 LysE family translocator [Raoultella ornithinolytica]MCZ0885423.1 LysE family translocator [Raoultella ornithinolytica]RLP21223.1 LysE family translocator [Raoultella ornithinolytica]